VKSGAEFREKITPYFVARKKQGTLPCFFYLNAKISDSITNLTTINKMADIIVVAIIFLSISGFAGADVA